MKKKSKESYSDTTGDTYLSKAQDILNQLTVNIRKLENNFDRLNCEVRRPTKKKLIDKERDRTLQHEAFPHYLNTKDLELPLKIIYDKFKYISAGPSKAPDFAKTYIYPEDAFLKEKHIIDDVDFNNSVLMDTSIKDLPANISDQWTIQLLDYFVDISRRCRDEIVKNGTLSSSMMTESICFLVGDPGVGKSCFINYMFSMYADCLRKEKSIWIRLDLNNPADRNSSFEISFRNKTINILKEKYKDEINLDSREVVDYICEEWRVSPESHTISIEQINTCIQRIITASPYTVESKLDNNLVDLILKYLSTKKGYSFIFIIDGLDRVSLDSVQDDKYSKWLHNLIDIISNKRFIAGLYLISIRNISLVDIMTRYNEAAYITSPKKIHVYPADLKKILDAKREHVKEYILEKTSKSEEYKWITPDHIDALFNAVFVYIFSALLDRGVAGINDTEYDLFMDTGYKYLEDLCSNNFRALIRLLRNLFGYVFTYYKDSTLNLINDDIRKKYSPLKGKEYKAKRVLVSAREEVYDYRVAYSYNIENGEIKFRKKALLEPFIPNIFNFIDIVRKDIKHNMEYRALLKLRIIQYLLNNDKEASMKIIIKHFNEKFGYNTFYLKYEIDEMIYTGVLKPSDDDMFLSGGDYIVVLNPIGKYIIENISADYIYHEIIVDDTPIPRCIEKYIHPVRISMVDTDTYVAYKLQSVLFFIEALHETERQEEAYFNEKIAEDEESFADQNLYLIPELQKEIYFSMEKNIAERLKKSKGNFIKKIEKVFGFGIDVNLQDL